MEYEYTSPEDYVKGNRKSVTLPSGAIFVIRRIPPRMLGRLMRVFGTEAEKAADIVKSPEFRQQFPELMAELIPSCVVLPKITVNPEEDSICIDDIGPNDLYALIGEIFSFSGLTPEAVKTRKSFRRK